MGEREGDSERWTETKTERDGENDVETETKTWGETAKRSQIQRRDTEVVSGGAGSWRKEWGCRRVQWGLPPKGPLLSPSVRFPLPWKRGHCLPILDHQAHGG